MPPSGEVSKRRCRGVAVCPASSFDSPVALLSCVQLLFCALTMFTHSSTDRKGNRSERPVRERQPPGNRPDRGNRAYQTVPAKTSLAAGQARRQHPQVPQQRQQPSQQQLTKGQLDAMGGRYGTPQDRAMLVSLRDGYKRAALGHKLNGSKDDALKMFRIAKQLDILINAIDTNLPIDLKGLPPPAPVVPIMKRTVRPSPYATKGRAPPPPTRIVPVIQVPAQEMDVQNLLDEVESLSKTTTDAAPTRKRPNPEDWTRRSSTPNVSASMALTGGSASTTPYSITPSASTSNLSSIRSPSPTPSTATTVPEDVARFYGAPTSASSVMEALEQRLDKYKETQEKATAEGNASKARRLGRIVKQYETAMKAYQKGLDFDYDSLPAPPGFPPIPMLKNFPEEPKRLGVRSSSSSLHGSSQTLNDDISMNEVNSVINEIMGAAGVPFAAPSNQSTSSASGSTLTSPITSPIKRERPKTELNAKVDDLVAKQQRLKKAAVEARNAGNKDDALKYLRLSKGFDPIIEAVKCGLPIDESSIPQLPPEIMVADLSLL